MRGEEDTHITLGTNSCLCQGRTRGGETKGGGGGVALSQPTGKMERKDYEKKKKWKERAAKLLQSNGGATRSV